MLIIFDLDDTLIRTSHSILPLRLKKIVATWQEKGHFLRYKPDVLVEKLQEKVLSFPSTKEGIKDFLKKNKALYRETIELLEEPLPQDAEVEVFPGAMELLTSLKRRGWKVACVTKGKKELQIQKMEKAGFDFSLFSKIVVASEEKGVYYQKMVKNENLPPSKVTVCGDRQIDDLLPAKKLGYNTIWVKQGRAERDSAMDHIVDHTVFSLFEVRQIVLGGFFE